MISKDKIYFSIVLLFVLIGFIIFVIYLKSTEVNEKAMIEKSKKSFAIITRIQSGNAVKSSKSVEFKYKVGCNYFKYEALGDFTMYKVGDTIQIKYSVKDHSIATVENSLILKSFK